MILFQYNGSLRGQNQWKRQRRSQKAKYVHRACKNHSNATYAVCSRIRQSQTFPAISKQFTSFDAHSTSLCCPLPPTYEPPNHPPNCSRRYWKEINTEQAYLKINARKRNTVADRVCRRINESSMKLDTALSVLALGFRCNGADACRYSSSAIGRS